MRKIAQLVLAIVSGDWPETRSPLLPGASQYSCSARLYNVLTSLRPILANTGPIKLILGAYESWHSGECNGNVI